VRSAELRVLSDALEALPAQYREVLILRELEELSYKEIVSRGSPARQSSICGSTRTCRT